MAGVNSLKDAWYSSGVVERERKNVPRDGLHFLFNSFVNALLQILESNPCLLDNCSLFSVRQLCKIGMKKLILCL